MKKQLVRLLTALTVCASLYRAAAQGTAFTYQGRLNNNGNPANGSYDLSFSLYPASTGGVALAGPLTTSATGVTNGLFTVTLDFGSNVFTSAVYWLDISVRTNGGGAFAGLSPRQQLTPVPYAVFSENSGAANSVVSNGVSAPQLNTGGAPASGQVLSYNGSSLVWTNTSGASSGWSLNGNSATGNNFLGTTNNQALYFVVNNVLAGTLFPIPGGTPDVAWGEYNYFSAGGNGGNVIAGGGYSGGHNYIYSSFSSIGGGYNNQIDPSSPQAVIAGGAGHRIFASGSATIGGGGFNTISNSAGGAIPGGLNNVVIGDYGFAAGNTAQAINPGAFVWADDSAGGTPFASTANNQFSVRALGGVRFVTGGAGMTIDGVPVGTGGGGGGSAWNLTGNAGTTPGTDFLGTSDNQPLELWVDRARALRLEPDNSSGLVSPNVIGGSPANTVGAGQVGSTIAGGGGLGLANSVNASFGMIGGGNLNTINTNTPYSVIVGGRYNMVENGSYGGQYSFIGGGISNVSFGPGAFIGGGGYDGTTIAGNTAGFPAATVVGGVGNSAAGYYATVAGGSHNSATSYAFVGGGSGNTANGYGATIPGGTANTADGDYSFAAGDGAQAMNNGSFVWADNIGSYFPSTADDQFSVRATGGVRFITGPAGVTINGQPVLTGAGGGGGSIGWGLTGNTNTDPSMNYLGTADGAGLELRVNALRGLRLDYATESPAGSDVSDSSINVNGGFWANAISAGVVGATIAGGGDQNTDDSTHTVINYPNTVTGDFGTVGGGNENTAGFGATVPGGYGNIATGNGSFAAGRNAHTTNDGSFIWGDGTQTFTGSAAHSFDVQATGGANFYTSSFDVLASGSFNVLAPAGVFFDAGTNNFTLTGEYMEVHGLGNELAYLGGDGSGNDVQIGSLQSGVTAVSCYNATDRAYMHLYCSSITITGGADLAEPFQISAADREIPQGAVVVIDAENPGYLRVSDQPYDTRVAGVVSGANGVNPGIQMQQQGLLEGGKNVALTGRVYVQADATAGPIKPGDLLTTSATRGHAMKVSDHSKAQGAILGKAMTSLKEGKGMVLVLVTLQ